MKNWDIVFLENSIEEIKGFLKVLNVYCEWVNKFIIIMKLKDVFDYELRDFKCM